MYANKMTSRHFGAGNLTKLSVDLYFPKINYNVIATNMVFVFMETFMVFTEKQKFQFMYLVSLNIN